MAEDLDAILKEAENFMDEAERHQKQGEKELCVDYAAIEYTADVYYGIRALYEQNKVLIELLKEKK